MSRLGRGYSARSEGEFGATDARQHRRPYRCVNAPGTESMHSQVSSRDLSYATSEKRIPSRVDEDQRREWYERARTNDRRSVPAIDTGRVSRSVTPR